MNAAMSVLTWVHNPEQHRYTHFSMGLYLEIVRRRDRYWDLFSVDQKTGLSTKVNIYRLSLAIAQERAWDYFRAYAQEQQEEVCQQSQEQLKKDTKDYVIVCHNKPYPKRPDYVEDKWVDFDCVTNCWGVFGLDSGFCYAVYSSEDEANKSLKQEESVTVCHNSPNKGTDIDDPKPLKKAKTEISWEAVPVVEGDYTHYHTDCRRYRVSLISGRKKADSFAACYKDERGHYCPLECIPPSSSYPKYYESWRDAFTAAEQYHMELFALDCVGTNMEKILSGLENNQGNPDNSESPAIRKEKTMKLQENRVRKLFKSMGVKKVDDWSVSRLAKRTNEIHSYLSESEAPEGQKDLGRDHRSSGR